MTRELPLAVDHRHDPPPRTAEAEPVYPVWGYGPLAQQFYQPVDPVKACALGNAVELTVRLHGHDLPPRGRICCHVPAHPTTRR